MSTSSLYYQQSVFKRYRIDKYLSDFLPARWRKKISCIDMEQNYVTVTVYTGWLKIKYPIGEYAVSPQPVV